MQLSILTLAALAAAVLGAPLSRRSGGPTPTVPDVASHVSGNNPLLVSRAEAEGEHKGGVLTWYDTGMGSCGFKSNDGQLVAAMNQLVFDPQTPAGNPNKNPLCNRKAKIELPSGKSVEVTIVDRLPKNDPNALDLSRAAFEALAPLGQGTITDATWKLLPA